MKPTNINLGNFYNKDRRTIAEYKKKYPNIYEALKRYFISEHTDLCSKCKEHCEIKE